MALKPNELNQLNVVSFQTNFTRLPNVNFFCQRVNIPAINLGIALQNTPFSDMNYEGDKLTFEQMTMNFYVNEDLSNYLEVYSWLISLGFPDNYKQYNLFEKKPCEKKDYLSDVVDKINQTMGSGSLFYASQGIKRNWKMRCDNRSPRYTTQWKELAKVY